VIPGEIKVAAGDIELNRGRKAFSLEVTNSGDRPIQVGSHYHFAETNAALKFDRKKANGCRLNIAAGTAVRFEARAVAHRGADPAGGREASLWIYRRRDGQAQMKIRRLP